LAPRLRASQAILLFPNMLANPSPGPSTEASSSQCPSGHRPRLSYRIASPTEEPDTSAHGSSLHDGPNSSSNSVLPDATAVVHPPRARMQPARSPNTVSAKRPTSAVSAKASTVRYSTALNPPNKKRPSLLGGLFVKEPSSAALERLAQKLIAEHGELSPRAIPGVSSAKMPDTVPKVNSKWDGRPGSRRLKDSRGRGTTGTKSTSSGSSARSRSAEPSDRDYASSHGDRPEPWQSSSTFSDLAESSITQFSAPRTPASDIDAPHSGGNVLGKMPRPHSARSHSLRSPSGSSLPPITFFFPDQIPDPPALPLKSKTDTQVHAGLPTRPKSEVIAKSRPQVSTVAGRPPDALLDNIPSLGATSEASPETPISTYAPIWTADSARYGEDDRIITSFWQPKPEEVLRLFSGKNVRGPPAVAKRKASPSTKAFLAGEARPLEIPDDDPEHSESGHPREGLAASASPIRSNLAQLHQNLEKRPDSSRERLGLRASMLVDTDSAPMLSSVARVQQDLEKRPDSSRARLGLRASMIVNGDTLPWQSQENIMDGHTSVRDVTSSSPKIPTSLKSKSKGFGIFGKDKADR
jgi:hypothetical protein